MIFFWQILPWVVSFFTLLTMWMAGNKNPYSWLVGLANQILWCAVIIHAELWGLLPTTVGIIVVYTRNFLKWREDELSKRISQDHPLRQRF